MNIPVYAAALGSTVVLIGAAFQFLRDARNLSGDVGAFNQVHEELVREQIAERRKRLHWFQFVARRRLPREVRREIRQSLPPDEVIIVRDIDRWSVGWAFVGLGSLVSAVAGWWQLATS